MNSELTHNQTYAFRLPPFLIQQARGFADFHEYGVFTDKEIGGIGHSESHAMYTSPLRRRLNISIQLRAVRYFHPLPLFSSALRSMTTP